MLIKLKQEKGFKDFTLTNCNIKIAAKEKYELLDITHAVEKVIKKSEVRHGSVSIVSMHTTTAILLNENETLLLQDFKDVAKNLLPIKYFEHDRIGVRRKNCPELPENECKNGQAHCLSILLPNSQTVHISHGKLKLGTYQRILFWELDEPNKYKHRKISLMIMGLV